MGLSNEEKKNRDIAIAGIKTFKPEDNKEYVFISYKSDDWKIVLDKLVRNLVNKYGLRVYFDKNFEDDNSSWVENMKGAIASPRCKAVLACVSREYMASYACAMELMRALSASTKLVHSNKFLPIVPIVVDDSGSIEEAQEKAPVKPLNMKEWDAYKNLLQNALKGTENIQGKEQVHEMLEQLQNDDDKSTILLSAFIRYALDGNHERNVEREVFDSLLEHLHTTLKNDNNISASDLFDESLIGSCPSDKSAAPVTAKTQAPVVPQPAQVITPSSDTAITPQTTIAEFRDYMANEGNNPQLLKLWGSMKKGPGYVVLAAILGGPGIGGSARKNFVTNIAQTASNGVPNPGTWSSMVAGYMNDSRSLGEVANVYKAISGSMTLGKLEEKFRAADETGFQPKRGNTAELLESFAVLYHTGDC
jgi:hypothetical protein